MAEDSGEIEMDFLDDFIQQTNYVRPHVESSSLDQNLVECEKSSDDAVLKSAKTNEESSFTSQAETTTQKEPHDDHLKNGVLTNEVTAESNVGVFKRPKSPSASVMLPSEDLSGSSETSAVSTEEAASNATSTVPIRARRDSRLHSKLDSYPAQRCFLSTQKRKRPESDAGHLATILKELKSSGKLLIPNGLLLDYLHEGGVDVSDSKIIRLLGVAAEHHSAAIIQDAMQIYLDSQHDRRKGHSRDKDNAMVGKNDKKTKNTPKAPVRVVGSAGVSKSAPKKTGGSPSRGQKRKLKNGEMPDENSHDADMDNGSANPSRNITEDLSVSQQNSSEISIEADDDPLEKVSVRSTATKEDRDQTSNRSKKKDEKDVDAKSLLTLELLSPVLREHGYHVGRPPYFVN